SYGNEESVGKAVRDSGLARSELFILSKLPAEIKDFDEVLKSFDITMKTIGLDYIDLYIIHSPRPLDHLDEDYTKENIEAWRAMESIYKTGKCRAIGVSNFNITYLTSILENCTIKPSINQIKFYIGNTQSDLVDFCRKNDILVTGYMPMAKGAILKNKDISSVAKRYRKTLPQICLRYVMQKGIIPITKSVHEEYIIENRDIDFELSERDISFFDDLKNTETHKTRKLVSMIKKTIRFVMGENIYFKTKKLLKS
ncbi:MAG TPA: aldo/keto reductase, partial [Bacteroidales bacterium]|nr:aldo/keto reductase [Bacteroidales bacterium]